MDEHALLLRPKKYTEEQLLKGLEKRIPKVVKDGWCTFAVTKKYHVKQQLFFCKDHEVICCQPCAHSCHEGHDLELLDEMDYCACNKNGTCEILTTQKYNTSREETDWILTRLMARINLDKEYFLTLTTKNFLPLPLETNLQIIRLLPGVDLARLVQTSKACYLMVNEKTWKHAYNVEFQDYPSGSCGKREKEFFQKMRKLKSKVKDGSKTWKELYSTRYCSQRCLNCKSIFTERGRCHSIPKTEAELALESQIGVNLCPCRYCGGLHQGKFKCGYHIPDGKIV